MVRLLLFQDSFILSESRRFMPLNNHWVETAFVLQVRTTVSLFSVTVVLLARRVGFLTGSVGKQRMWLIESGLGTWGCAAGEERQADWLTCWHLQTICVWWFWDRGLERSSCVKIIVNISGPKTNFRKQYFSREQQNV